MLKTILFVDDERSVLKSLWRAFRKSDYKIIIAGSGKEALEKGDYNSFGLSYLINSYSDAKRCIQQYLTYLVDTFAEMNDLNKAAEFYQQIVANYQRMEQFAPFTGPTSSVDQKFIPEIIELVKESKNLEDQAMEIIKKVLEV